MPINPSLIDEHQSSRKDLQKKLDEVSLYMRKVNELALTVKRGTMPIESKASSLIEDSYRLESKEDVERLSRHLEGICDDRDRAMRECDVIQGHMVEVVKSLKIIENIENGIFEKANSRY